MPQGKPLTRQCLAAATTAGSTDAPVNYSGRVVAAAWWLFCYVMLAAYTGNLAAFLTVKNFQVTIE